MSRAERFAAFGVPAFRRYFAAQFVSQTATWFQTLTVALVVADRTGSAFALSGTAVATFGPTLVFSWIAGRACDRWSPRVIAIIATIVLAATAPGLMAVFAAAELSLPWLYGILAIGGSASTFVRVACQALIYELVGPLLLQNAAIWAFLINSTGRIAGPGLAGAAIALVGPTGSLVINAALATLAALTMASIKESQLVPRRVSDAPAAGARPRLPRPTGILLVLNASISFWAMNLMVALTAIVSLDFGGDSAALGVSHALNAVGAVSAASIITRLKRVTARVAATCVAVYGITQVVVAAPPDLVWMLALTPVLGLGLGLFQSSLATAVQTTTPPVAIGRAMSLVNLGSFGTLPFGALALGALIETIGPRPALMVCGGACLLLALVAVPVLRSRWAQASPDSPGQSA